MGRRMLWMLIGLMFCAIPATAQEIVSASPDVTIDLGASVVTSDADVAVAGLSIGHQLLPVLHFSAHCSSLF